MIVPNPRCDSCGKPHKVSAGETTQELWLFLSGGYNSFIDSLGETSKYSYVLCHDCALKLVVIFHLQAPFHEHLLGMSECKCHENGRKFDQEIEHGDI